MGEANLIRLDRVGFPSFYPLAFPFFLIPVSFFRTFHTMLRQSVRHFVRIIRQSFPTPLFPLDFFFEMLYLCSVNKKQYNGYNAKKQTLAALQSLRECDCAESIGEIRQQRKTGRRSTGRFHAPVLADGQAPTAQAKGPATRVSGTATNTCSIQFVVTYAMPGAV